MKKIIVDKKYNNKKLSKLLKDHFPSISENLFYKTLRKKDIKINGKRITDNIYVYENDEILIYISDELLENQINIKTIYEDDNILVINKPTNLEVTGNQSLTTLIHKKYSNCGYLPMPCHRLDRNTCGLVLFAKNEPSLEILLEKFKQHEIEKHYYAMVYGIPKLNSQTLIAYLFKDAKKSLVYISNTPKKGYSKIITSYHIIEKYPNNTCLLDIQIETGKTHQIRAHLAHIGFPIIGDGKYGNYEINKKFKAKTQKLTSYKLKFLFSTNSGILDYLNNFEICLDCRRIKWWNKFKKYHRIE